MSDETKHALNVIVQKKRRLQLLQVQAAQSGYNTAPEITMEIEDLTKEIPELERQAQQAVSGLGLPASLITGTTAAQVESVPTLPQTSSEFSLAEPSAAAQLGERHRADVVYVGPALVLDAPPIADWIGQRTETVARLSVEANKTTWLALHGDASRGKTTLSRLLAAALSGPITWVQFAGQPDEASCILLERLCATLTQQPAPPHRATWYRGACDSLGQGAVLVLDDLPDLAAAPQLRARLEPFVRICAEVGIQVITTSLFPIPHSLLHALSGLVVDAPAPPLTDRDAEEVLNANGAPPDILKPAAKLINVVVRQHPTLLLAACRYLQSRGWKLAGEGIQGILEGAHTSDLAGEVHQKLLATVPDGASRDLLYRLTLVGGPFSEEDVDALASTAPQIDRARERLRDIVNSWVERQQDGKSMVSPLLGKMGLESLATDVKKSCHRALADSIVRRGRMNQQSTFRAIIQYHAAGDLGKAGTLLLMILNQAQAHPEWVADDPLLMLWTTSPLPVAMDLNLRLAIRGLHIVLYYKLQKPLDFLFKDLDALLSQATGRDRLGAAGAVSCVISVAGRRYAIETGRWLRRFLEIPPPKRGRTIRERRRQSSPDAVPLLSESFPLHVLPWMLVGELTSEVHVTEWLDTFGALPRAARQRALMVPDAHIYCVVVADSLTGAAQAKIPDARDWPGVVSKLASFAARARAMGADVLWAAFVRARITAQAEFCRDVDGAVVTAAEASRIATPDPIVRFLIEGTIGRQLLLAKRVQEARTWLALAIARNANNVFPYERANVLLAASHAFGLEDAALGVKYANQAADVAESDANVPPEDRVRAWCELGLAQFLADGPKAAFRSWDRAGEYLFNIANRGDTWKELMVLFAHGSGYLATIAETGKPPTVTRGGDEYAPLQRGVFMTTNPARVTVFEDRREGMLWRTLGYYADAVGDSETATKWKSRSAALGRRDSVLVLVAEAGRDEIPALLRTRDFASAIEAGQRSAAALVVWKQEVNAGGAGAMPEQDMPAALAQLSDDLKRTVDEFAIILGLIPSVLCLGTYSVGADAGTAREEAKRLVDACRAAASRSPAAVRWEWAAELIERAYVLGQSPDQMANWSETFPGERIETVEILIRLAISTNATPSQAIASMLSVMPKLNVCYPPGSVYHRELLMPFVVRYWTHKFEHERFAFSRPTVVDALLASALAAPEEDRVVAVFRALHAGFQFAAPMPDEIRQWLFG